MDPNANLKEQSELLATIAKIRGVATADALRRHGGSTGDARRQLDDLRAALTEWLNAGGFAPEWSRYPTAARYYGLPMTFRMLACGATFEFDRTDLPLSSGLMSGPWRKVADRRYHRLSEPDNAVPYRVGSINVRVWPMPTR